MRRAWRGCGAIVAVATAVAAAVPLHVSAASSAVNWEQESPASSPPARAFAASAYDSNRDRVVVFGGANATTNFGDTWEWDGSTWSNRLTPVAPPALMGSAMAYDSARDVAVLFGGSSSSGVSSDTWEWDGTNWTKLSPTSSPPPMALTAMVFDSSRSRIVLFGQYNQFGVPLPETWEFDGTTWTQAHPATAPTPRLSPGLAFDSSRNRTVLFGGWDPNVGRMADTWEWDGSSWTRMTPTVSPYARQSHSMAYDPVRDRTILFGGDHIQPYSLGDENDTWEWDGAQWSRDWTDAAPAIRADQSMVYDSALGRMVLFGGFDAGVSPNTYDADTWELGTGILTPPGNPALSATPTSGEFGSVDFGDTSSNHFFLTSSGTGPATMTAAATGDFAIWSSDCPSDPDPLAAGTTCVLFLTFAPTADGDRYGTLTVTGNFAGAPMTLPLHGVGIARDFTIAANPTSVSTTQGYPIPSVAVSTSAIGDTGTVQLSYLSNDPGITASFSPSSVTAGGSSTLTITAAASVQPGIYGVSVVGAEGSITHRAEVTVQIAPVPDFTIAASPSSVAIAHGSTAAIGINLTAINAVGSVSLTASVVPAGLSVQLDPFVSSNAVAVMNVTANFADTPRAYTITVTGTEGGKVHATSVAVTVTTKGIVNGGFETGDLTGWSSTGVAAVVNNPHTGAYSAQVGNPGDSTLSQTFDVAASGGKLVFWYRNLCTDKVKNDWFTATLADGVTGATTTLVGPVCTKNGSWTKVTANLSSHAGNFVTVTFAVHDGTSTSSTTTLIDDVALA
jgi:hypothetical protein